ncbi:prephenate dehydrogenase [Croceiramulus getboli]|nr:prephenate dehydrogenase [Flavobacteriaceae bacterium YJPT1-3]
MKKVVSIGVGLIGGSFLRDLRRIEPEFEFYGMDQHPAHLEEAQRLGVIDKTMTLDGLAQADLVILAIPVDAARKQLPAILDRLHDQALVIDMGSTKAGICEEVAQHPKRRHYLAAHPIAGTEFSGPSAAIDRLFEGKVNIICEVEKTAFMLQEFALDLFKRIGMRIRYMDPESHDKHIAYVSHLSHISSFMLGKTVIDEEKNERDIFDMAGSGFASTVRLAKSNPDTWTPIFEQNRANIIKGLEGYIENLTHFKSLMESENFEGVHAEMVNTNHIKNILKGIS